MPARRWKSIGGSLLAGTAAIAAFGGALSLIPSPSLPAPLIVAIGIAIVAGIRPPAAVQALAAATPTLSTARIALHGSFDWTSFLVLSLIAGAGTRYALDGDARRPHRPIAAPLTAFTVVVITSLIVALSAVDLAFANASQIAGASLAFAVEQHLHLPQRFWPLFIAAPILQGVALAWICSSFPSHERQRAVRMLVVGGAAAAALNLEHAVELALRTGSGLTALWAAIANTRINVHFRDVNAAGSYFLIPLFAALGMARQAERGRALLIAAAGLAGAGLMMSGSRAALLTVAMVLGAFVVRTVFGPSAGRRTRVAAVAFILVAAIGTAVVVQKIEASGAHASDALRIRAGMGAAALRAAETHPVFGIGIGEFYNRSSEFMSPEMLAIYPRENAHNNFLQILAELGFVGLAAFLWLLYASLAPRRGDLDAFWRKGRWSGLKVGLLAFLVTCLTGHPLLVPEVAFAFWIALGLAAAEREDTAALEPSKAARVAALAICAMLAISIPIRASAARASKNLQDVVFGVSHWRRPRGGEPYRRLAKEATFFVPATGVSLEFPLRLSVAPAEPVALTIRFDGVRADRIVLADGEWHRVRLLLPRVRGGRWIRVNLEVETNGAPTVLLGRLKQR